jgi:hypothetical protein
MSVHYGVKETMLTRLETNLKAVAGMSQIDRQKNENFENYASRSCFINDVNEMRTRYLLNCIKVDWTVVLVAFESTENSNASTILNALIALVKAAILGDVTLNGSAYNVKIIRIDTDEGFAYPYVEALFTLQIQYLSIG